MISKIRSTGNPWLTIINQAISTVNHALVVARKAHGAYHALPFGVLCCLIIVEVGNANIYYWGHPYYLRWNPERNLWSKQIDIMGLQARKNYKFKVTF